MEASPHAYAHAQAARDSLWERAPAWRNLTMAASLLTLTALAVPALLPEERPAQPPTPAPRLAMAKPAASKPAVMPAQLPSRPAHRVTAAALLQAPPPATITSTPLAAAPAAQLSAGPAQTVCALRQQATAPVLVGIGTVSGFEDRAEAMALIQVSEANSGGKIDPDYIENTRAIVRRNNGTTAVVIVPKGMSVTVGDRVTVQNGYRNMALPCNYVPVMVASDIGPPPPAETPQ